MSRFFPTGVSPVQFADAERNNFKSDEYCQDGFSNENVNTLRTSRIHRGFRAKMA